MRVVMTLLVRDEADIVAANIEHHLDLGVDFIVATDNASVDGTADILGQYEKLGVLELHREPAETFDQDIWVTRMARRAAAVHRASWVLNSDADEFLCCADDSDPRSLKEILAGIPAQYGLVGLTQRAHVPDLSRSGPWSQTTIYSFDKPPQVGKYWKVMHRADPWVQVSPGNHSAEGPLIGPIAAETALYVQHYPDRGLAHYERKIRNGAAALAGNPRFDPQIGFHWRKDYDRLADGTFEAEYRARHPNPAELEQLIARGEWVLDTRVPDRLRALGPRARRPDLLRKALES